MDILIAALGVLFGGAGAFTYQKIKSANAKITPIKLSPRQEKSQPKS